MVLSVWHYLRDDGASLLDKQLSFLKPSKELSTSPLTSHDSETTDSVSGIVHTGKEAQCEVSAVVRAGGMKMFSVAMSVVSLPSTCLIIAIVTYTKNV
jgi:hypothetical protein